MNARSTHIEDAPPRPRPGRPATGRRGEEGSVSAWVVIILPALICMLGLSLDAGFMIYVGQQLQVAADAAALAGVVHVRDSVTDARQAAADIAALNIAVNQPVLLDLNVENAAGGDIVLGRFHRDTGIFEPTEGNYNAIKVVARRTDTSLNGDLPLLFAPYFGKDTANVARQAIAMLGGGTGAGLICLDPEEKDALWIHGSVSLTLNGGAIQVNSANSEAAKLHSGITTDAFAVNAVGGIRDLGTLEADLNEGVDPIPDPLAYLAAPTWDPAADLGTVTVVAGDNVSISPGYYSGGLTLNNGSLTLSEGIYILDGAGLQVTGGNFYADGCMFYITGTGFVKITGNGIVEINAPNPDEHTFPGVDTYEGISFFQARDNTNKGTIIGTSAMNLGGTLYFPSNAMVLGGDALQVGNQLVVGSAEIMGNSVLIINYDGRNPAPGNKPFLVQ